MFILASAILASSHVETEASEVGAFKAIVTVTEIRAFSENLWRLKQTTTKEAQDFKSCDTEMSNTTTTAVWRRLNTYEDGSHFGAVNIDYHSANLSGAI